MKIKDIKPGMVVAIGSMASVNARWGGWGGSCQKAIVVAIGKYAKNKYWRNEADRIWANTNYKTTVLIAKAPDCNTWSDDTWTPDAVGSQRVLMLWSEYEKKVKAEEKSRKTEMKARDEKSEADEKRFELLEKRANKLGVTIYRVYQNLNPVGLSFDDMDKLLLSREVINNHLTN